MCNVLLRVYMYTRIQLNTGKRSNCSRRSSRDTINGYRLAAIAYWFQHIRSTIHARATQTGVWSLSHKQLCCRCRRRCRYYCCRCCCWYIARASENTFSSKNPVWLFGRDMLGLNLSVSWKTCNEVDWFLR